MTAVYSTAMQLRQLRDKLVNFLAPALKMRDLIHRKRMNVVSSILIMTLLSVVVVVVALNLSSLVIYANIKGQTSLVNNYQLVIYQIT